MDKIEKIKEWVKKQKKEELARNSIGVITGKALFVDANELLSFLDTLSEEPDKSLEEAAYKYSFDSRPSIYGQVDVIDAFKAGTEWQKNKLFKEGLDAVRQDNPSIIEKTIAGVFVKYGMDRMKEEMLKDAMEGFVATHLTSEGTKITVNSGYLPKEFDIKNSDKIRLIVLKDNEDESK